MSVINEAKDNRYKVCDKCGRRVGYGSENSELTHIRQENQIMPKRLDFCNPCALERAKITQDWIEQKKNKKYQINLFSKTFELKIFERKDDV